MNWMTTEALAFFILSTFALGMLAGHIFTPRHRDREEDRIEPCAGCLEYSFSTWQSDEILTVSSELDQVKAIFPKGTKINIIYSTKSADYEVLEPCERIPNLISSTF